MKNYSKEELVNLKSGISEVIFVIGKTIKSIIDNPNEVVSKTMTNNQYVEQLSEIEKRLLLVKEKYLELK